MGLCGIKRQAEQFFIIRYFITVIWARIFFVAPRHASGASLRYGNHALSFAAVCSVKIQDTSGYSECFQVGRSCIYFVW